jgi:hypothetical protein
MTGKPMRCEPARYIHKRLRHFSDYLIADETHEEKGATTAQGNAVGALAASCKKVLALTGTLIGGYADHLCPLLFRLAPSTLAAEDLHWKDVTKFSERYGRIETRLTERDDGGTSNHQSRGGAKTKTVRPGTMPTLFGRHLIGNTVFLGLKAVSDQLPELDEGGIVPVELDAEVGAEYDAIEQKLKATIKDILIRGDKRLLGTMLQTLLAYPDHPFGWGPIGYSERSPSGGKGAFVTVAIPKNLDAIQVRPKEQKLIDLVLTEKEAGRKVWVYVQLNGERNVEGRLHRLLEKEGLAVQTPRSSVKPALREEWIQKHGPTAQGGQLQLPYADLLRNGLQHLHASAGRPQVLAHWAEAAVQGFLHATKPASLTPGGGQGSHRPPAVPGPAPDPAGGFSVSQGQDARPSETQGANSTDRGLTPLSGLLPGCEGVESTFRQGLSTSKRLSRQLLPNIPDTMPEQPLQSRKSGSLHPSRLPAQLT